MRSKKAKRKPKYRSINQFAGDNLSARPTSRQLLTTYVEMEKRQLLAALIPTYINGVFTLGDPNAAAPYNLADTFFLESRPGATKTIYLDFDGHHSVNNAWNHNIMFEPYDRDGDPFTFSVAELIELQRLYQNVVEDFLPFDVNVTTKDPGLAALTKSGPSDQTYGIRSVHTQPKDGFGNGIGGVAFLNSFDSANDDPCFNFNKGVNNGAMTQSHEIGHTLGLRHDGLNTQSYHPGTGANDDPTSWGPIMGAPFGKNVVHWSKGEYAGANNTEDDLVIITSTRNGFGFRPDDYGDTIATAANLAVDANGVVFQWGIVGTNTDVDVFRFEMGAGNLQLNLRPFRENPNLDILANLYDGQGNVIATSNPLGDVTASFNLNLPSGTYFVSVEGTGRPGRYTSYGSMGFYTIEGVVPQPVSIIGESGTTQINHVWKTINLGRSFINPVVIVGAPSRLGGEPITIRVRNVQTSSFEMRVQEWDYLDGVHGFENVSYLVVEQGITELSDGTLIQAGKAQVSHRWSDVSFSSLAPFSDTPIVFSQTMSVVDPAAVVTRHDVISSTGFRLRLQEEEAADRVHGIETVGWIAIQPGNGGATNPFETGISADEVTHLDHVFEFQREFHAKPHFFAQMQTFNGGDTAFVRYRQLNERRATVYIEEERSFDTEIRHGTEVVAYLAIESVTTGQPPQAITQSGASVLLQVSDDPVTLAEALRIQQSWGEDALPLHCLDDQTGACCCPSCLGDWMEGLNVGELASVGLAHNPFAVHLITDSPLNVNQLQTSDVPNQLSGSSEVRLNKRGYERSLVRSALPSQGEFVSADLQDEATGTPLPG